MPLIVVSEGRSDVALASIGVLANVVGERGALACDFIFAPVLICASSSRSNVACGTTAGDDDPVTVDNVGC